MTPPASGSGHLLTVVVDEWAAPPPPPALESVALPGDPGWTTPAHLRDTWQRDMLLAMRLIQPQSLCLITGV